MELKRISSQGRIIGEIDGLRFIAISMVVVAHLEGIWFHNSGRVYQYNSFDSLFHKGINVGPWGVQLFFIISGFIVSLPWVKALNEGNKMPSLKEFYLRRLTRLEPPYIISTLLFFILLIALHKYSYEELKGHLLPTLFYVHNFVFGYGSWINRAAWSLEIEIQFYLLAPIIISLIYRWINKTFILAFIITLGYPFLLFYLFPFSHTGLHNFIHYFIAGIVFAKLYVDGKLVPDNKKYSYDIIVLFILPIMVVVCNNNYGYYYALGIMPVLLIVVFVCAFRGRIFNYLLTRNWVVIIGGACYSIYLLHGRLISIPIELLKHYVHTGSYALDLLVLFVIIAPITVVGSLVFYMLIERPCMDKNWPSKLLAYIQRKITFLKN